MFLFHSHKHDFELNINIFGKGFDRKISKELFKVGLPLAFSQSSTNFGAAIFAVIIYKKICWIKIC